MKTENSTAISTICLNLKRAELIFISPRPQANINSFLRLCFKFSRIVHITAINIKRPCLNLEFRTFLLRECLVEGYKYPCVFNCVSSLSNVFGVFLVRDDSVGMKTTLICCGFQQFCLRSRRRELEEFMKRVENLLVLNSFDRNLSSLRRRRVPMNLTAF